MGQQLSKNNSETINWNKIKTENISSSIPNFNGLSNDAKTLIASLNIPEITESQTSEFTVNHILNKLSNDLNKEDHAKFTQLLEQVSSQTANDDDLSATSPFISSEMYNHLIKNDEIQKGGGKKKKYHKKGGAKLDDDSDTSSTSSDSSMEDLLDSTEEEVRKYKENKNKNKKKHNKHKDSDSELSGGELSYLSSSAHTEGEYSDSNGRQSSSESVTTQKSHESSSAAQSSDKQSTVTDNNGMQSTSISVNTEDINMVSDY
jgi:hypothetical protein